MAQIIKFPRAKVAPEMPDPRLAVQRAERHSQTFVRARSPCSRLVHLLYACVWCLVVLSWPLWSWLVGIDLLFQLARTMYYWHTPEVSAVGRLVLHLLGATALVVILFRQPGDQR